jgi:8-oxo-dGTP pyrophosphatase MutT (NUDIX family)
MIIVLEQLRNALEKYEGMANEEPYRLAMIELLKEGPLAFSRERLAGHFTASAWVIDVSEHKILLLHHAKLNKWLQPGGHADGEMNTAKVAQKELMEETGLELAQPQIAKIFDLDIHLIPEHKGIPAHHHYDLRYLFLLDQSLSLNRNPESNRLEWVRIEQVEKFCAEEPSILRMVAKSAQYLT